MPFSEPRRGVRVASFDIGEIREVAEMRAALEVPALRHAAPHITQATLDAAEQATLEGDKSRDVRSWEDANRRFHRLILEPCKMPRLLAAIDDLHAASARFLFATGGRSGKPAPTTTIVPYCGRCARTMSRAQSLSSPGMYNGSGTVRSRPHRARRAIRLRLSVDQAIAQISILFSASPFRAVVTDYSHRFSSARPGLCARLPQQHAMLPVPPLAFIAGSFKKI